MRKFISRLRWILAGLALAACSKSDSDPQIFTPHLISPQGVDLSAAHALACNDSRVNFSNTFLTEQNFQSMFSCANYDHSLDELQPLFTNADFPKLLKSLNLVLQSPDASGKNSRNGSLKDTLGDWLKDGPQGTSRVDRLLPFLASLIRNPSFQDGLPVLNNILQAGTGIWNELLPKLADVVYTDLFPDNLENVFDIFNSFTNSAAKDAKDYATSIKRFARFLLIKDASDKTVATRGLGLLDEIRNLQPDGTSLNQFIERMLEFGVIDDYFLNSGSVRGEVIDPKLNEQTDDATIACEGLNDTPEQRQTCASQRLWKRGADGSEAPITQLAGLVVELQKDHPEFLPSLAGWLKNNGPRVEKSLGAYVVRAQIVTKLSGLKLNAYLDSYAEKNGISLSTPVNAAQLSDVITKGFANADFPAWLNGTALPVLNKAAFGDKNAEFLAGSSLPAQVSELFQVPEVAAYASVILPGTTTMPLEMALTRFNTKYHSNSFQISYHGKTQSVETHLGDIWVNVVQATLGQDVVMHYVFVLLQNEATDLANDFKNKGQPIGEWYFNSPYGSPGSTEMIVAYSITTLGLLDKYYKHKAWLEGQFTDEVFSSDDDKRAFRLLLEQVPNIVTYVRSGASRTGSDLSRAMAKDVDGYLVKTYVNLIVKATETGWVSRAASLMAAYQASPDYKRSARLPKSDDIDDRRQLKVGVEALDRILRSLTQPETRDNYDTTTLSRLLVPLSSIVSDARRAETEKLVTTSANQVLSLTDSQINDFFGSLHQAKPAGDAILRRESYKSVADLLRNQNCPDVVLHLAGLFRDNAVKPALDFFATKIDDGSLQKMLLFVRRMLGYAK